MAGKSLLFTHLMIIHLLLLETDHCTPLHLLISSPIAFDRVDAVKGITDAQYICLMTASVNNSATPLQAIAVNPSGKWSTRPRLLPFSNYWDCQL